MKTREFARYGVKVNGKNQVVAGVYTDGTNELYIGVSSCHAKDNYNKQLGRKIATGRAKAANTKVVLRVPDDESAGKTFKRYADKLLVANAEAPCLTKWNFNI